MALGVVEGKGVTVSVTDGAALSDIVAEGGAVREGVHAALTVIDPEAAFAVEAGPLGVSLRPAGEGEGWGVQVGFTDADGEDQDLFCTAMQRLLIKTSTLPGLGVCVAPKSTREEHRMR